MIKANYNKVYDVVLKVISEYNLNTIPISLSEIIKQIPNMKLCSYSKYIKNKDCTIQDLIEHLGSDLGAYLPSKSNSKFAILYNDTKRNRGLDRFTIAHELGHHFLNHAVYLKDDKTLIRGLKNTDYDEIEKEANCFARNLLTPAYLMHCIGIVPTNISEVTNIFDISKTAAETRSRAYMLDLNALDDDKIILINQQFQHQILFYQHIRSCLKCNNMFSIKDSNYCNVCGNKKLYKRRLSKNMIHKGIELNKNNRAKICSRCENEEIGDEDNYCKICRSPLINYCEDEYSSDGYNIENPKCEIGGSIPLSGNARYCPYCGKPTTFFKNNLITAWDNKEFIPPDADDDLPF